MIDLLLLTGSALLAAWLDRHGPRPTEGISIEHWCRCRGPSCPRSSPSTTAAYGTTTEEDREARIRAEIQSWRVLPPPPNASLEWLFLSPAFKREAWIDLLLDAEPYTERTDWDPEEVDDYFDDGADLTLVLQGDTWPRLPLWDLEPTSSPNRALQSGDPRSVRFSKDGRWAYLERILPAGKPLSLHRYQDLKEEVAEGSVIFDAPVNIPIVYERQADERQADRWVLWMSHTPFELLSQKLSADRARGHVVVSGLGIGWVLQRVANNPKVTSVTLIEQDRDLADWILPALCPFLPRDKPIHVVIGDVHEELPKISADVALIDIWPTYGEIADELEELADRSPGVHHIWGWGLDWPW